MRILSAGLLPLLLLAACTEAPAPAPKTAAPAALPAGLWKTSAEVSQFKTMDAGTPVIAAKVGDKSSGETCVGADEGKKPKPALFGAAADGCTYGDFYLANGTVSGTINCATPKGPIMHTLNGTYSDDTLEAVVDTASYLTSDGDVTLSTKLSARRAGTC